MGSSETRKVTPEEIEAVARTVVGPAYDKVQAALASFRDTHDGAAAFGGSPAGEHLAELHSTVRTVFVHTVHGVGEDLDTVKHNLTQAARNWDGSDQSSAERSQSLASHLSTTPTAAQQAYNHQRQENRDALVAGHEMGAPGRTSEPGQSEQSGKADAPDQGIGTNGGATGAGGGAPVSDGGAARPATDGG